MGIVRSYYNNDGGFKADHFEPISYLISGKDTEIFDSLFGKPLGKIKSKSPIVKGKHMSAELNLAQGDYKNQGLVWVKNIAKSFRDSNNTQYGLHTKFEVVRNKSGKIKDFKLVDIKFCPENGAKNPFTKVGYYA